MKHRLVRSLALLALLALPRLAYAGRPEAWADSTRNLPTALDAHRAGRWSLDFGIAGNFTLASFKGTSISATRATSSGGAWRFGLSYNVSTNTTGTSHALVTDSSAVGVPGDLDLNDTVSLAAVVLRLHRFHPGRRVSAYLGVGPGVSWSHRHMASDADPTAGTRFVNDEFNHQLGFSLVADLGAEAIVARAVGLFAQYGSSGGYAIGKDQLRSGTVDAQTGQPLGAFSENTQTTHGWSLGASTVRFGLSLYL